MRKPGEIDWAFKKAVAERGLTLRELSKAVGISHTLLSMYSRGRYVLTAEERKRIARALKMSEAHVFSD